jgi:hypothetical protein
MGDNQEATEASLAELRAGLDLLHGQVASMDTTQKQVLAQLDLVATAVNDGAKFHADAARQFAALEHRIEAATQAMASVRVRSPSPEEDDADPKESVHTGKTTLRPAHVTWTGNTAGASSATPGGGAPRNESDGLPTRGGGGILGAPTTGAGGAGGGGSGGVGFQGGGRNNTGNDTPKHQLKMSFPRFDGDQPRIWKDKCMDYFLLFNVHPSLWLISATLHMDGNAALWLKAYRLRHDISTWPMLMTAVEAKFGADDHRKYMKQLLALKQRGTVEEYQVQF